MQTRDARASIRLVHILTVPGSLLFLSGQIAFMKRRGYSITVITSAADELTAFGIREGVATRAVDMPRRMTPGRDLVSVCALIEALRDIRPDIVHAHTPKAGLLGMLAAKACSVPARIYHMRGLPLMTARGTKRAVLTGTERVACALAHRVVCVSRSLREAALERRLVARDKALVLGHGSGNGVDCEGRFNPATLPTDTRLRTRAAFGIPPEATVLGFVGRIVRDKGIEELWHAWQMLRAQFPSLHWLLVGPFEARDPISSECRRGLERDPRIHHVPFTTETPALYASMDVVALPTYREGFPNVPLEAAAMGLPVVATRVIGCVDAVQDEITGALVPAGDPSSLAAAIQAYVNDPSRRARHGRAGRARALADFRPQPLWEELDSLYRHLHRARGADAAGVLQSRAGESG